MTRITYWNPTIIASETRICICYTIFCRKRAEQSFRMQHWGDSDQKNGILNIIFSWVRPIIPLRTLNSTENWLINAANDWISRTKLNGGHNQNVIILYNIINIKHIFYLIIYIIIFYTIYYIKYTENDYRINFNGQRDMIHLSDDSSLDFWLNALLHIHQQL